MTTTARQLSGTPKWASAAIAATICGLIFAGCNSGGSGAAGGLASSATTAPAATSASSATSPSSATTPPPATAATAAAAPAGAPNCPTPAQVETALSVSYSGPKRIPAGGGGIICDYTGTAGNADVAIFAHTSAAVFAGQVANVGGAPGMKKVSGVGDGAFGMSSDNGSIVNAYADASHTVVAAHSPGPLSQTEALAGVALADN